LKYNLIKIKRKTHVNSNELSYVNLFVLFKLNMINSLSIYVLIFILINDFIN